jgi:hypothetical protein
MPVLISLTARKKSIHQTIERPINPNPTNLSQNAWSASTSRLVGGATSSRPTLGLGAELVTDGRDRRKHRQAHEHGFDSVGGISGMPG